MVLVVVRGKDARASSRESEGSAMLDFEGIRRTSGALDSDDAGADVNRDCREECVSQVFVDAMRKISNESIKSDLEYPIRSPHIFPPLDCSDRNLVRPSFQRLLILFHKAHLFLQVQSPPHPQSQDPKDHNHQDPKTHTKKRKPISKRTSLRNLESLLRMNVAHLDRL